jgi:hypothetical protein
MQSMFRYYSFISFTSNTILFQCKSTELYFPKRDIFFSLPTITEFIDHTENSDVLHLIPFFFFFGEWSRNTSFSFITLHYPTWFSCGGFVTVNLLSRSVWLLCQYRPLSNISCLIQSLSLTLVSVLLEMYTEVKIWETMHDPLYTKVETHYVLQVFELSTLWMWGPLGPGPVVSILIRQYRWAYANNHEVE